MVQATEDAVRAYRGHGMPGRTRPGVMICLFIFSFVLFIVQALPAQSDEEYPDAAFFVGTYRLIGKALDREEAFLGRLVLRVIDDSLVVERTVGNSTIIGSWALEYALGKEMRVLRMRFGTGETRLEGTYQWSVDFDNYPRLSGHLYRPDVPTDDPGMEVFFIIHPQ